MLPVIEQLLVLQDRDRQLLRLQAELNQVPVHRKYLQDKADAARRAFEEVRTRTQQLESERKRLELEVETLGQRRAKVLVEQNNTRSNDQYKAFQHQIETTEAEISAIEDKELELMMAIDAARQQEKAAAEVHRQQQAESDALLAELAAREANLRTEHDRVKADRTGLAAGVDPMVLARYDRILRNRGENVVVGLPKGVCGGCHMKLPMQVFVDAKGGRELVTCPSCARILYYTPDMEPEVPASR